MYVGLRVSTPYPCLTLMKFEFSGQIVKTQSNTKVMKIHPVGAELFHADGRTGMTKTIVALRNFAKRLTNTVHFAVKPLPDTSLTRKQYLPFLKQSRCIYQHPAEIITLQNHSKELYFSRAET